MDALRRFWNTNTKIVAAVLGAVAMSFLLLWVLVLRPDKPRMGYEPQPPQQFDLHAGETRALAPFSGRVKVVIESQRPLALGYLPKQVADTMSDTAFFSAHAKDMRCARANVTDAAFECELPAGDWTLLIADPRTVHATIPSLYGNPQAFSAASVPNRVRLSVAEYRCLNCTQTAELR
jgi:hypothetical protein